MFVMSSKKRRGAPSTAKVRGLYERMSGIVSISYTPVKKAHPLLVLIIEITVK